jgi:predicted cupin superfamily sugar epimerase
MTEDHAPAPAVNPRAAELIRALALAPHPEGGFYRETFRSALRVSAAHGPSRNALTTIYFLLAAGGFSAWHRVRSDEAWHWYEGEALELLVADPDFGTVRRNRLGPAGPSMEPAVTVPANWWQAARPLGSHALCGCTVAPGFEFEDFSFLRDDPRAVDALAIAAPDLRSLL